MHTTNIFPASRDSMDCVWVISSEDQVELTMVDMDLEKANGDLCVFDSLTIYDGKSIWTDTQKLHESRCLIIGVCIMICV